MDYSKFFSTALSRLHDERRYRVFADLERIAGRFPHAVWHSPKGSRNVVIWCSNDYLGMGQHPKVVGAMVETATRVGTGAGGTRNIAGTHHPLVQLGQVLFELYQRMMGTRDVAGAAGAGANPCGGCAPGAHPPSGVRPALGGDR